jgi:hypothetical protein
VDDSPPIREFSVRSDSRQAQHPYLHLEQPTSGPQLADKSKLRAPRSPISTRSHDRPIDVGFSSPASQRHYESRHGSNATLPNQVTPFNQSRSPSHPSQVAFSRKCGNQSYLSSCAVEFCAPHALPSQCWAAHTEMELIGLSGSPTVCPYCNTTSLHRLASMAQTTEVWRFNQILHAHLPLLEECDRYGNSCVHFAAGSGASLAQLEALASAGAPMKRSNNAGQTFLHVLNTKRYSRKTLPPILEWALREKGAMTKRDSQNRTVWHCIFQHGISPDVFRSILPYVFGNQDDMMTLDNEDHTPLDCLKSYWQRTGEVGAIDDLHGLQSCGYLPLYFAANRTLPLGDATSPGPGDKLPTLPEISSDVSRLTIGVPTKRHDPNEPPKYDVKELLSTYKNGGALECTTIMPSVSFDPQPAWLECTSPLPSSVPKKARKILGA